MKPQARWIISSGGGVSWAVERPEKQRPLPDKRRASTPGNVGSVTLDEIHGEELQVSTTIDGKMNVTYKDVFYVRELSSRNRRAESRGGGGVAGKSAKAVKVATLLRKPNTAADSELG